MEDEESPVCISCRVILAKTANGMCSICETKKSEWKNNDELFFSELKQGHQWQQLPALFFKLHGFQVEMPELTIRSSIKEAGRWKDTPDLIVNGHIIEVKSRNEIFTSGDSFPYETAFIDTVSGYDAKVIKPLAYVFVSRPTGAMLVLKTNSSKGWAVESKFDHIRKIQENFYLCKRKHLQNINVLVSFIKNNGK